MAYLDEGALPRQIGGRRVMANQLRHLVSMAERSTIERRVIPFSAGGVLGASAIRAFPASARRCRALPSVHCGRDGTGSRAIGAPARVVLSDRGSPATRRPFGPVAWVRRARR
ncbi:Scr1 family TA system antitoxin-like transcriptional regulator [Amycolatopsis sp. cmx-11-51]|uniref:Scr1 family TA system antitoxin-like transcriptional regulator n=1 Tax=unclassified Amycolatopsis TaxID=2618356 RepID=UPI0039E24462